VVAPEGTTMSTDALTALRAGMERRRTIRNVVLTGAHLCGQELAGLRADGLDLSDADLRGASLTSARLNACSLRDAKLEAADFTDAVLRICDLDDVRAAGARFVRARLENSSARGARLDATDFSSAVLTDTDLSRASLREARLDGASASGVGLRGSDLRGASLRNAVLTDADLRGADLTGADLHEADLHGADLRGVTGLDAARLPESAARRVVPAVQDLSETMAPIVAEVLRTAGRSGAIDADTAQRLFDEAGRLQTATPQRAPNPEALAAVLRVIAELGDGVLPVLTRALQLPNQAEPPKEVQDVIRRLCQELSLDEGATTEDLLHRLTHG
jgi:uncharacterized protein YjbI with pentapeptide repeats